jgi:hypothetical protein
MFSINLKERVFNFVNCYNSFGGYPCTAKVVFERFQHDITVHMENFLAGNSTTCDFADDCPKWLLEATEKTIQMQLDEPEKEGKITKEEEWHSYIPVHHFCSNMVGNTSNVDLLD